MFILNLFHPIHLWTVSKMGRNNDRVGLAELLDRALKKGIILNADLVISVAEVPLLAANLRLALASVETMLKYGMMNDLLIPPRLDKKEINSEEIRQISCVTPK